MSAFQNVNKYQPINSLSLQIFQRKLTFRTSKIYLAVIYVKITSFDLKQKRKGFRRILTLISNSPKVSTRLGHLCGHKSQCWVSSAALALARKAEHSKQQLSADPSPANIENNSELKWLHNKANSYKKNQFFTEKTLEVNFKKSRNVRLFFKFYLKINFLVSYKIIVKSWKSSFCYHCLLQKTLFWQCTVG